MAFTKGLLLVCLQVLSTASTASGCSYAVNQISQIPHRNFGFSGVSNDLSDYSTPVATGATCTGGEIVCLDPELENEIDALINDPLIVLDGAELDSYISYAQSIALLAMIGASFASLALLVTICCCCGKLCLATCCKHREPDDEAEKQLMLAEKARNDKYKVLCLYLVLIAFIITNFTIILLGHIGGSQGWTRALLAVIDAPDSTVALAKQIPETALSLLTTLVGVAGVNTVNRIVNELDAVIDFDAVHVSFDCARDIVAVVGNDSTVQFFLDQIDLFEDALNEGFSNPGAFVDDLFDDASSVLDAVDAVTALLNTLSFNVTEIDISNIEASLASLEAQLNSVFGTLNSAEATINQYLSITNDVDEALAPVTALLTESYTATSGTDLRSELVDLRNALTNLPDEAELENLLSLLNTTAKDVETTLDTFIAQFQQLDDDLKTFPSVDSVNASLEALTTAVNDLDISASVKQSLTEFVDNLSLPSTDLIFAKLDEIIALTDKVPCVLASIDVISRVNESFVELPPEVNDLTAQLTDIEILVNDSVAEIELLRDELQLLVDDSGLDLLLDGVEELLNDTEIQLTGITDIITEVQSQLSGIDANQFDFASIISTLNAAKSNFSTATLDITSADFAILGAVNRSDLNFSLNAAIDYADNLTSLFATAGPGQDFVCFSDGITTCYDFSGGNSGPVAPPILPFDTNGVHTSLIYVDVCPCPVSALVLLTLEQELITFNTSINDADNSIGLRATILPAINAAKDQINATAFDDVDAAIAAFRDFESEIAIYLANFSDAASIIDTARDFLGDIEELSNFTLNISGLLNDARSAVQEFDNLVNGTLDQVIEVLDLEEVVYQLITVDLDVYLNDLSKSVLDQILNAPNGIQDAIDHVTQIAKEIYSTIEGVLPSDIDIPNITAEIDNTLDEVDEYIGIVDTLRDFDGQVEAEGAYYFIFSAISEFDDAFLELVDPATLNGIENPLVLGFIVNGELQEYPNNAYCLTDECLRNTINFANQDNVYTVINAFGGPNLADEGLPSVPFSREQLTSLPLLFPTFTLLIAIMVLFLPCFCGNLLGCCAACIMIPAFLFAGGLLMPVVVVYGDGCSSLEALAISTLDAVQPVLCEEIGFTTSPEGFCVINVTVVEDVDIVAEIDGPELLESLLLNCQGRSLANTEGTTAVEPLRQLITRLGDDAIEKLDEILAELLNDDSLPLQQNLIDVLLNSTDDIAAVTTDLVNAIDQDLGCEDISNVYSDYKDVLCCDLLTAIYWSVAPWYILAFALLCCACPVACCGARKFRGVIHIREQICPDEKDNIPTAQAVGGAVSSGEKAQGSSELQGPGNPQKQNVFSRLSTRFFKPREPPGPPPEVSGGPPNVPPPSMFQRLSMRFGLAPREPAGPPPGASGAPQPPGPPPPSGFAGFRNRLSQRLGFAPSQPPTPPPPPGMAQPMNPPPQGAQVVAPPPGMTNGTSEEVQKML